MLSGFLKIAQRAMVKRRSWVSIAVCRCLHSSLIHHRNINPFENKVWERYIFIKKCVRSFIEVRKLCLIMFPLIFVYVNGYTTNSLSCILRKQDMKRKKHASSWGSQPCDSTTPCTKKEVQKSPLHVHFP